MTHIPYGAYWCTPFARWQGSLARFNAVTLAADTAAAAMKKRNIDPTRLEAGVLGISIPQHRSFFGFPWVAGRLGAPHLAGPTLAQACATSARCLAHARSEVLGGAASVLVVTGDRTSNGPHLIYPDPLAPGGAGTHEHWVLDNFALDPFGGTSMLQTGENVAAKHDISTEAQHDLVLRRYAQYEMATADDGAFLKRFMDLPFTVPGGRKPVVLTSDEGIHPTSPEAVARLKPVMPGGTITFAGQTHPADGAAGMVVTDAATARELRSAPIDIEIRGIGQARVARAMMPTAPVPAARRALEQAGIDISDLAAIKTHNPFIVNDVYFLRETGADPVIMNNYGSSLVWGHPQGPTGLRAVIELIEELAIRGGGWGLFTGCAAGDSAMAVVVKVG